MPSPSEAERQLEELSTRELVAQATQQTGELIREELQLAQLELRNKAKRAGVGGAVLAIAALLAVCGFGALVAAAIMLIATVISAWLAGIAVGGGLLIGAGIFALLGLHKVRSALPVAPELALAGLQRDIDEIREGAHNHD